MTISEALKKIVRFQQWRKLKKIEKYTMVGHNRLYDLFDLVTEVEKKNLPGAVVECGVWKGGAAAVMGAVIKQFGYQRRMWLFDSFAGLPEPTVADGAAARAQYKKDRGLSSVEDVKIALRQLSVDQDLVSIVPGWFADTLPSSVDKIKQIALLRLDCDWYESTKTCLNNLYQLVVPGGYIVVDDYGSWAGARKAVDEFLKEHNLGVNIRLLADGSVFFIKPDVVKKAAYWVVEAQKYSQTHLRIKRVANEINQLPLKNGSVLDLGCGPATLNNLIDYKRFHYYGVDVFDQHISNGIYKKFDFENGDWSEFPYQQKFEIVVLSGLIEYLSLDRIKNLLDQIRENLIAKNGYIILTYTNFDHYSRKSTNYHPAWVTTLHLDRLIELLRCRGLKVGRRYPSYYFIARRRLYSPRVWLLSFSRYFGRQIIFILKTERQT
jgi:O-methyltransferase